MGKQKFLPNETIVFPRRNFCFSIVKLFSYKTTLEKGAASIGQNSLSIYL